MRTVVGCILIIAATSAFAANFSGKWAIQNMAGRGGATILVLNQVGNEVIGTIGQRIDAGTGSPVNSEILGGKVEGDTITFYIWMGADEPFKQTYHGTISGDEILFTIQTSPGGPAGRSQAIGPRQVTAKRTK